MISRGLVLALSLSQFICWGVSYYLIGVFGVDMARDLGWPMTVVYGGFSGALVVMGLTSAPIGRLIDRHGGRRVMSAGSVLIALGCLGLSLSHGILLYALSWACLGVAMRMTLYEAAFASLARIGGHLARRPISQVTLLGGLASTAFWPIGYGLASLFGWRGALIGYAAIALLTLPLHWSIPDERHSAGGRGGTSHPQPLAQTPGDKRWAGLLYVVMVTVSAFLNSGMSAHMIGIMSALGMSAGAAVWLSSFRGIGQSSARLCELTFGMRLHPLVLGVLATVILPASFLVGLGATGSVVAGAVFAFTYGASNGLITIVRGTQPLVLFDPHAYGSIVGQLTAPGFIASALAPIAYASLLETAGPESALVLSAVLGGVVFAAAALLYGRFARRIAVP
ncbi:MFS transporter [Rhodoligotrophos defluvii]|uniref:MFS transporter n=1 Tax=Rhodoligotrophos defluvii TaxID=2561934 RepID=UPI0010CA157D|nr:MFS transporter [Rhodoligotrophos defluvii]